VWPTKLISGLLTLIIRGILFVREVETCVGNTAMVWVDLEMTGLDPHINVIMEMACIITDKDLNIVAKEHVIINVDEEILGKMDDWCRHHHRESGLMDACRNSPIGLIAAEEKMVGFLKLHVPSGICPLAGSTVHHDKKFLDLYMPQFSKRLHYRIIDVSTIKELSRRWFPNVLYKRPKKCNQHRAMIDTLESIEELKFYKNHLFRLHC